MGKVKSDLITKDEEIKSAKDMPVYHLEDEADALDNKADRLESRLKNLLAEAEIIEDSLDAIRAEADRLRGFTVEELEKDNVFDSFK